MSTPAPSPGLSSLFNLGTGAPTGRTAAAVAASVGMDTATSPFASLLSSSLAAPAAVITPALPAAPPLPSTVSPQATLADTGDESDLATLLPNLATLTTQAAEQTKPHSERLDPDNESAPTEAPEAEDALAALGLPLPLAPTKPSAASLPAVPTPPQMPATQSARARALQAAAAAANAQATEASGKAPGPDQHAFDALLKHAEPAAEPAPTLASGLAAAAAEILQRGVRRNPGLPALGDLAAPTNNAAANFAQATSTAAPSPLASLDAAPAKTVNTDLLLAEPSTPADTQSPDFSDEIGTRLTWLAERRIGHAQIRVAPPELGAVDVRLQMDGDRVRVDFSSPHAEVRAALEASLPRLREMLESQGMTLVDSQIGQHAGGRAGGGETPHESRLTADAELSDDDVTLNTGTRSQRGLLDEYA